LKGGLKNKNRKLFKLVFINKNMKCKRLGNYQRTVLRGIKREGSQPATIKKGYSHQVESLLKRNLIKKLKNRLYLTEKGKKRMKNLNNKKRKKRR
jgi:hypothetical protein